MVAPLASCQRPPTHSSITSPQEDERNLCLWQGHREDKLDGASGAASLHSETRLVPWPGS